MVKKIKSFNEIRVDILQAMKRALLQRGVLPIPEQSPKATPKKSNQTATVKVDEGETKESMVPDSAEVTENQEPKAQEEKKAEEGPEEIIELTERTHDILFEANTVFPFTLFPDTLTLDREKLTIAERFFWRVAKITSVPVSEILTCQSNVGPFFGSIHLVFSFFADNERTISYLWRHDAAEMQQMLHGYIIAHKREIDTTTMSTEDLKILLKEIGQGASD